MNKKDLNKILFEFNNSNFKNAYQLAININKNERDTNVLKILTFASFNLKNYSEAIEFGLDYIKHNAEKDIQVLNIIGTSYSIKKDFNNGNKIFQECLLIDPSNISIRYNLGLNLYNQKKYKESESQFIKVIDINNNYKESELFYGMIQSQLGRYNKAIEIFKRLIKNKNKLEESYYNLGIVYQKIDEFSLSIEYFEKAIKIDNQKYQYFNSKGISFQKLLNYEKADFCYKKAIKLNNNYAKAYSNLGLLNQRSGFFEEALNYFNIALDKDPQDYEILYNKSICLLENGNFKDGLSYYKWRQSGKFLKNDKFNLKNINNRKILITCDQGLGDIILLTRFVKLLSSYGAKVTFEIPESMTELFKCLSSTIIVTSKVNNYSNFDYKCSLGDLFEIFKINKSNIPLTKSYLEIENKWIKKWKIKLDKNKINVGIAWQGKKGGPLDEGRSFNLNNFERISKISNLKLVSLQKNDGVEQIDNFNKKNTIINFNNILDIESKFMDTAGLMKNLDLVITSDTSIVHLAGALGINTWLLLQKYPFWYWQTDGQNSIWYDSVKIYKQEENHDWQSLFLKIEEELKKI